MSLSTPLLPPYNVTTLDLSLETVIAWLLNLSQNMLKKYMYLGRQKVTNPHFYPGVKYLIPQTYFYSLQDLAVQMRFEVPLVVRYVLLTRENVSKNVWL